MLVFQPVIAKAFGWGAALTGAWLSQEGESYHLPGAAGAIADTYTVERAKHLELDSLDYLKRNDSYSFFKELRDLLFTGPTRTNVADIVCLILL
jgi:glycerate-2-kinase